MVRVAAGSESVRRRQFSSCDYCRRKRIACDASQLQERHHASSSSSDAGSPSPQVQCTNCSKRSLSFTYDVSLINCFRPSSHSNDPCQWIRNRGSKKTTAVRSVNRPRTRQFSRRLASDRPQKGAAVIVNNSGSPEEIRHHEIEPAVTAESDYYAQFVPTYSSTIAHS